MILWVKMRIGWGAKDKPTFGGGGLQTNKPVRNLKTCLFADLFNLGRPLLQINNFCVGLYSRDDAMSAQLYGIPYSGG